MGLFNGKHENELDVPPQAVDDAEGLEIARIWAAGGQQVVTLRAGIWDDPASWGLMLVDLAKHIAIAYEQLGMGTQNDVLLRIKEVLYAEWSNPTDEPTGRIVE